MFYLVLYFILDDHLVNTINALSFSCIQEKSSFIPALPIFASCIQKESGFISVNSRSIFATLIFCSTDQTITHQKVSVTKMQCVQSFAEF